MPSGGPPCSALAPRTWAVHVVSVPERFSRTTGSTRTSHKVISAISFLPFQPKLYSCRMTRGGESFLHFIQCLGEALKHGFDKGTYWSRKWTKRLDHSKMFLTELLKSRGYLTFVEFNFAVFVMFTYLCIESRERRKWTPAETLCAVSLSHFGVTSCDLSFNIAILMGVLASYRQQNY